MSNELIMVMTMTIVAAGIFILVKRRDREFSGHSLRHATS